MGGGMLPGVAGVSILGGWKCHLKYLRVVGHGLPMTLFGSLLLALAWSPHLEGWAWLGLWAWLQLSLVLHLTVDVLFYRWRAQLLWPVSGWGIGIGLISWNDPVPPPLLDAPPASAVGWPE